MGVAGRGAAIGGVRLRGGGLALRSVEGVLQRCKALRLGPIEWFADRRASGNRSGMNQWPGPGQGSSWDGGWVVARQSSFLNPMSCESGL